MVLRIVLRILVAGLAERLVSEDHELELEKGQKQRQEGYEWEEKFHWWHHYCK